MKVVSYLIFMEYTMLRSTQGQVIEFVADVKRATYCGAK